VGKEQRLRSGGLTQAEKEAMVARMVHFFKNATSEEISNLGKKPNTHE